MTDLPKLLIVGAGPVGLMMACELARHGVPCRIIDKATERSQTSKALAIFPRTLEAFETTGVIDQVLAAGQKIFALNIHRQEKKLSRIELGSIASPYPFALSLPQAETERLLIERLTGLGIEVERGVELTGLRQKDAAVEALVRRADRGEETMETPWLLGCDGAHGTTRHLLGMEFEGAPYEEGFILADVRAESSLAPNEAHLFFSDEGLFALFPFRESNRVRLIANVPLEARAEDLPEPTLEDMQRIAEGRGPRDLRISDAVWISRFHISHRKVADFRQGRVFLAGDAAHIHSPAGGQGMNTGIQDSFNLAWKLALVVKGRASPALLASYHGEREPIARGVINLTDRLTRFATLSNPVATSARDLLLQFATGIDFLGEKVADRMSELAVHYRSSILVENHGKGAVRAGDRATDGELRDATGMSHRLFELFREPRHHLLIFLGNGARALGHLPELADEIKVHRIARGFGLTSDRELRDVTGAVHSAYDLSNGGLVLVRPDGYIAFRGDKFDFAALQNYLARIFNA